MSYTSIGGAIYTILSDLIPNTLNAVYNNDRKEIASFPTACIIAKGHRSEPWDTAGNKRNFIFIIRLYVRIAEGEQGSQDAETDLRRVADSIIETIEGNVTLNGTCSFTRASQGDAGFVEREFPMRYMDITVEASRHVLR